MSRAESSALTSNAPGRWTSRALLLSRSRAVEETLDSSVGGVLSFEVCRGGRIKAVDLRVDDLHALTPGRYFEVGGGVVNELSYQQARNHGIPARGVYVAHPGYMLRQGRISRGSVIDSVNSVPGPSGGAFADVAAV